jgi:hypothetical protein
MKSMIKNLLREALMVENLTKGSFIVYHRTNTDPNKFNMGFLSGGGAGSLYGKGLYTCYDLNEQLKPGMLNQYGPYIVKFNIMSTNNFIIFDINEAKKIYGQKFNLLEQLKKILKGEYNRYYLKNDKILKELDSKLMNGEFNNTSDIAFSFSRLPNINNMVNGLIFTGENDGKVLVLFNLDIANPISYSIDNGNKWVNIKDSSSYQIGKDTRSSDLYVNTIKKLISQKKLSDEHYIQAPDDLKLEYIKMLHSHGESLSDSKYIESPYNIKLIDIKWVLSKNYIMSDEQYNDTPDDLKYGYLKQLIKKGLGFTDEQKSDYERLKNQNQ